MPLMPSLPSGHPAARPAVKPPSPLSSALCTPLRREELRDLVQTQRSLVRARGQTIVQEGDRADRLFVLNSGAVALQRSLPDGRRQVLDFLWRGDVIGLGLGEDERFGYTALTLADTALIAVTRPDLERMTEDYPELSIRLARIGSERLAHAFDRMTLLGQMTAEEKMAAFLLELSESQSRCGGRSNPVWVPMGTAEIADYLGLRLETVSRRTSAFQRQGLIRRLESHRIELLDPAGLREIADGGEREE